MVLIFVALSTAGCTVAAASPSQPAAAESEFQNHSGSQPVPKKNSAATSSSGEDSGAENDLLQMANKSRQATGAPPLRMDETLRQAARAHAQLMITRDRLEHQYSGEPALLQRIARGGSLKMDYAGENLASASCGASANDALMHSPPHRKNLLDRGFNVAGIAAVWSKGMLYVVQDFAHEIPSYSAQEGDRVVGQAIDAMRQQAGLSELKQLMPPKLNEAACSLSRESRPNAHLLATAYDNRQIIAYTQSRPEILPQAALNMLRGPSVHQFAVGACYARNAAYPNGTYWVAILLY
jgi:uncharacterized protein YkwD